MDSVTIDQSGTRPARASGVRFRRRSRSGSTLIAVGLIIVAAQTCLVLLAWAGIDGMDGTRAYATGESLYSKYRRAAVLNLHRYAEQGDERYYDTFRAAIAVPEGDNAARNALQSNPPDLPAAVKGFLQARNAPEDIPRLIRLFLWLHDWAPFARGIDDWVKGDTAIIRLDQLSQELHKIVRRGGDTADSDKLGVLQQVDVLDEQLTPLEEAFLEHIAQAARSAKLLIGVAIGTGGLLLALGSITLVFRVLKLLRSNEARFRALVEDSGIMVGVFGADGEVEYRTPSWQRWLGRPDHELGARSLIQHAHPEDAGAMVAAMKTLEKPGTAAAGRTRLRHADGTWRHLSWSARNADNLEGVNGVIVNALDVTAETVLTEQLLGARKLEAIGQLAAGIAHDFNNIIAMILGFCDLLLQDLAVDSPQYRYAERIASSGRRARDLVLQILTFARQNPTTDRVPADVAVLAREAHELLRASLPASVEFQLKPAEGPLVILANPSQISQLIINLCVNASDALAGQSGRINLAVAGGPPEERDIGLFLPANDAAADGVLLVGRLDPDRAYARITVSDNGCGMAPDVLRQIFDPFFTTKRRDKGTGLGLALVHGIVGELDGGLVVESQPGRGSTFRAYFPLARLPADAPAA